MGAAALAVAAVLALGACASDDGAAPTAGSSPPSTAAPATAGGGDEGSGREGAVTVSVASFRFRPEEVRVPVGGEVTWTNEDAAAHTATGDGADPAFSVELGEGSNGSHRFDDAGTYAYHCEVHPSMTGRVVVG